MRRELHERFMPDGSRTRNILSHGSITFIIHRVIHSGRTSAKRGNHGTPCFSEPIAAKIPGGVRSCGEQLRLNRRYIDRNSI